MGTATNISIVATMSRNGVIGNHNHLLWKMNTDETRRLRKLTQDATIVVGRKTFEAVMSREGHPLSDRRTVILTHDRTYKAWNRLVAHDWKEIVSYARSSSHPVFVIGGEELFRLALKDAESMHLMRVETETEGDARFPPWQSQEWKLMEKSEPLKENGCDFPCTIETWERRNG